MKPEALVAPSLCPRCDAPALRGDRCPACTLELRHCGACQGVAAPFDQYCGFCGYELVLGRRRSFAWRLWLLAALVPLAVGLVFGVAQGRLLASSPKGRATVAASPRLSSAPTPGRLLESQKLKFQCAPPSAWVVYDYSLIDDPSQAQPLVIATADRDDNQLLATAKGEVPGLKPRSTVMIFRWADAGPPAEAALARDWEHVKATPPPGVTATTVAAPVATTIGGRPATTMVMELAGGDSSFYFERAYIQPPVGSQLFEVDALVPASSWKGKDDRAVDATLRSVKLL